MQLMCNRSAETPYIEVTATDIKLSKYHAVLFRPSAVSFCLLKTVANVIPPIPSMPSSVSVYMLALFSREATKTNALNWLRVRVHDSKMWEMWRKEERKSVLETCTNENTPFLAYCVQLLNIYIDLYWIIGALNGKYCPKNMINSSNWKSKAANGMRQKCHLIFGNK